MSAPYILGQTFYDHGNANGDPDLRGHTTDGGHVQGFTRARYVECDNYECRPVVVLDPESAEQVSALANAIGPCSKSALAVCGDSHCNATRLSKALRSLLPPPKPEVYAHVVIDKAGLKQSVCGKVWQPDPNVIVLGKCPDCLSIVNDEEWVA